MGTPIRHVDVLVVGAGISGIGAAYHLTQQCPDKTFVVLESKETFGGTWHTHRYPGIRSDSDLYTFGYRFKPWHGPPIATGKEILDYLGDVVDENDLGHYIHYSHQITNASWSTENATWTVSAQHDGDTVTYTAGFLWMCQGYYRHDTGYTPDWEGMADFEGQIVHPMSWPDDLELTGKRVVVIGSGATAATLIPAIASDCAHVTMLQRSPTYYRAERNANDLADTLRDLDVPAEWTHEIVRRQIVRDHAFFAQLSYDEPELVREELLNGIQSILGQDAVLAPHFTPTYRPWQQRVAFVPDGDLFHALRDGRASVVTDHIDRFTSGGILLRSGDELAADIVIAATGFNMNVLGDIDFRIDDEPLAFHDRITWRGAMFTGVPNLVWVFGYFRASWTLRVDLLADFVCGLLTHMDDEGFRIVVPQLRAEDADMALKPWVDPDNFNPGYLRRSLHLLPRQGDHQPWLHTQDYLAESTSLLEADLRDGSLRFDP